MSKALSSSQAKDYYQAEYTNGRESYYAENDHLQGEWAGALALEWGLQGGVEKEQFERLCEGQDPKTGEQLVKHVSSRTQVNKYGEEVTTSEHRAGWDATFSAPKSVSIAALVGGDGRLKQAHRESVRVALTELEKYTQARLGGNHPAKTTGKFIAAIFEHDSARPDRTTGYAAPQLHSHVVIFNVTETEQGKVKPVQEIELYRTQQYATAIYRMNLAERLQKLGYEIEINGRTGAPEIKGFSEAYLQANSPRREEVKREAQGMKERLEKLGVEVKEGAGLNQAAARTDRMSKQFDREEMRARHREMDAHYGHQAQHVTQRAIGRGPRLRTAEEISRRAREAVTFARDNAMEREAVADMRKVKTDALRRNMGLTTYEAVEKELAARQRSGEFVGIMRERQPAQTTTQRMLDLEGSNIQRVLFDKGKDAPIVARCEVAQTVERIAAGRGIKLNESQRAAVEKLLTSEDRIIGLQGGAGTGKTTVLATVREAAERAGYQVQGFAPTTRAAALLAESGMQTKTLQRYLREPQVESDKGSNGTLKEQRRTIEGRRMNLKEQRMTVKEHSPAVPGELSVNKISLDKMTLARYPTHDCRHRRLYVLDESSLASTRNISRFFERVGPLDKVLLVGDTRQHQAIEAGSPFEQLQKAGMETSTLTRFVRQRDPQLRQAVERLSAKEVREAVAQLQAQGRVIEITDEKRRLRAIAADYCRKPEEALVISPANEERVAINMMIHRELQQQGVVSPEDHRTKVYVNRQEMTGTERTFANLYVPGEDTIRYNRASKLYGIRAGEYAQVVAKNHEQNTITVRMKDGRGITYNPERLSGVSVYREGERTFAEGDRIQFRAPLQEQRVANGELGTVEKIEGRQFTVALDDGRKVSFDAKEFRHLDHGYAVTSYSSQGQTVDRVIVNADTKESELLLNQRMSYVALSRARVDARVYTNCESELGEALDRQVDKHVALDAFEQAKPTGQEAEPSPLASVQVHRHHVPDHSQRTEINDHGYDISW